MGAMQPRDVLNKEADVKGLLNLPGLEYFVPHL